MHLLNYFKYLALQKLPETLRKVVICLTSVTVRTDKKANGNDIQSKKTFNGQ